MKESLGFWKDRRIMVTGHTGFKGSWLLALLQHLGSEVWGYALEPESELSLFNKIKKDLDPHRWHHTVGDINDANKLVNTFKEAEPTVIFHLAAQALVRKSYEVPLETWKTNVLGTMNVLEAAKRLKNKCTVVVITTDKVYENQDWVYGYRETDKLGGNDPYSASKAATELAVNSWRKSFCGNEIYQTDKLTISTARAGNVIGGGDWSEDRIVPDIIRAWEKDTSPEIRNPNAIRPWQHVLDPLNGYLSLAEQQVTKENDISHSYNFGPSPEGERTVKDLIARMKFYWGNTRECSFQNSNIKEENRINLDITKAYRDLKWRPKWDFNESVKRTVEWHKRLNSGEKALDCCKNDLENFFQKK